MTKNAPVDAQWARRFASLLDDEPSSVQAVDGPVPTLADPPEVLTPQEMARADQLAISAGTSGVDLMERAGQAVADAVHRLAPEGARILVLAGPGNNGGDGFVAARWLAETGYLATVGLLVARERLTGEAALAAASWTGASEDLSPAMVDDADLIVDALFGAGLDRPIEGIAAETIDAVNRSGVPVLAVDLPSGVNGRDGRIMGTAIRARESVTFFRLKPGHLLLPGRDLAGVVTVADIGIEARVLSEIQPATWRNTPALWTLPPLAVEGHKYTRGHAVIVSGSSPRTGAARLAARGALRAGAGLVTVASPPDAIAENAAQLTAIMLMRMDGSKGLASILADERKNVVVLGPAIGVGQATIELVATALASQAAVVLDADALVSFAAAPDRLASLIAKRRAPVVLTPHEGEFARLFPELSGVTSKLERARQAAELTGGIVVLKGPDSVVASPAGPAAIANNAPPQLATAGSGDVLAGIVGGLLAQGMEAFAASAAAVWLHGEAGRSRGRGLIAEDLPDALPDVFAGLAPLD